MGGTRPWKAPETQRPLPVQSLNSTDVYSLGLLIWLVAIDGRNPFDFIIQPQLQGASRDDEIETLKQRDMLFTAAQRKDWLCVFLIKKFFPQMEAMCKKMMQTC